MFLKRQPFSSQRTQNKYKMLHNTGIVEIIRTCQKTKLCSWCSANHPLTGLYYLLAIRMLACCQIRARKPICPLHLIFPVLNINITLVCVSPSRITRLTVSESQLLGRHSYSPECSTWTLASTTCGCIIDTGVTTDNVTWDQLMSGAIRLVTAQSPVSSS